MDQKKYNESDNRNQVQANMDILDQKVVVAVQSIEVLGLK